MAIGQAVSKHRFVLLSFCKSSKSFILRTVSTIQSMSLVGRYQFSTQVVKKYQYILIKLHLLKDKAMWQADQNEKGTT